MGDQPSTLNEVLALRASRRPGQPAYTYLVDGDVEKVSWTYAELELRARAVAARLQQSGAAGGRALLLYPPGLDFIAAFFGCLYAGVVAVPTYPPHPARPGLTLPRLRSIVCDAGVRVVMTTSTVLSRVGPLMAEDDGLKGLAWLATDEVGCESASDWREPEVCGDTLAFLQYTSGSTNQPKGVMVSHRNLVENSDYIRHSMVVTPESSIVTWLPAYHDMGLIFGLIQPLFTGVPCYAMAPVAFLQQPLKWLRAVSRFGATHSAAPNFAYDLCAQKVGAAQRDGLDLSSWRVAVNGAEPIRPDTLRRFAEAFGPCGFRRESFLPGYGLAEATLMVSGRKRLPAPDERAVEARALEENRAVEAGPGAEGARLLVGSGAVWTGTEVVAVNPSSLTRCAPGEVGELWVSGPGVAQGYWNRPELSEQTFRARLADTGEGPFLRTGDLGVVLEGEVFVTGRIKDVIIIGGRNHYPQDIELTAEQGHEAVRPGCVAAFSVEADGEERLVVAAEVDRKYLRADPARAGEGEGPGASAELKGVRRAVRQAVSDCHGVPLHALVLLRVGSIPKTSSGKIRRHACRNGFLDGTLRDLAAEQEGAREAGGARLAEAASV